MARGSGSLGFKMTCFPYLAYGVSQELLGCSVIGLIWGVNATHPGTKICDLCGACVYVGLR